MKRNYLVKKSIKFFHDNEEHLIEEYGEHKYLLIYDGEVVGVYDTRKEGLEEGCKKYTLGTFAIQETAAEPVRMTSPIRVIDKRVFDEEKGRLKTMKMRRVVDIKAMKNYLLFIRFDNDEKRIFNCYKLITEDKQFNRLLDLKEFEKVYIDDMGLVCWDYATDINPYMLYEESVAIDDFIF